MATIKTTASQEKAISKVNNGLHELEQINLVLEKLATEDMPFSVSFDLGEQGKGRGKPAREYIISVHKGRTYNSIANLIRARRDSLRNEIKSLTAKNQWMSLSKHDKEILDSAAGSAQGTQTDEVGAEDMDPTSIQDTVPAADAADPDDPFKDLD